MKALFKHPIRVSGRLLWLGGELFLGVVRYLLRVLRQARTSPEAAKARWLQQVCRRLLRVFNLKLQTLGPVPSRGALVCNHLSYLDILVLGSIAPTIFVAKREVQYWPVFGWLATLAGTLFVHREKRTDVVRMTREIERLLDAGHLVVFFPEGTSSGGHTVLPFKSSLLEPATGQNHPLSAGLIQYRLADGDVAEEVCYWKDMTLLPHLINLLGKRGVEAGVSFTAIQAGNANRKELAQRLQSEVLRLKSAFSC